MVVSWLVDGVPPRVSRVDGEVAWVRVTMEEAVAAQLLEVGRRQSVGDVHLRIESGLSHGQFSRGKCSLNVVSVLEVCWRLVEES